MSKILIELSLYTHKHTHSHTHIDWYVALLTLHLYSASDLAKSPRALAFVKPFYICLKNSAIGDCEIVDGLLPSCLSHSTQRRQRVDGTSTFPRKPRPPQPSP